MPNPLQVVETSYYINTDERELSHDLSSDDPIEAPLESEIVEEEEVQTVTITDQAFQIIGELQQNLPSFTLLTDVKYNVDQPPTSSSHTILLTPHLPHLHYTAPIDEEEEVEDTTPSPTSLAPQCIYLLLQHIHSTLLPTQNYTVALQKLQPLHTIWEMSQVGWYKLYEWKLEEEIVGVDWNEYLSQASEQQSSVDGEEVNASEDSTLADNPSLLRQSSTASVSQQQPAQSQQQHDNGHRRFASTGSEIYMLPGDEEMYRQAAVAAVERQRPLTPPPPPPLPVIPSTEIYVLKFYISYLTALCYSHTHQYSDAIIHYYDAMNARNELDESLLAIPFEFAMVDDAAAEDDENVDEENQVSSITRVKKRTYLNACTILDAIAYISIAAAMRALHHSHISLQCLDTALQIITAIGSTDNELRTVILNDIACCLSDCQLYPQAQLYFEAAYSSAQSHTARSSPTLSSIERNQRIIAQHVTDVPTIALLDQITSVRAGIAKQQAIEAKRKIKKAVNRKNQAELPADPTQIADLFQQPKVNKKGVVVKDVSKTFPTRTFVVEPSAFQLMQTQYPAVKKKVVDPKAKKKK